MNDTSATLIRTALISAFVLAPPSFAQGQSSAGSQSGGAASTTVSEIVVSGRSENQLRLKKNEINRVGTLKPKELQKKQAVTFAQMVAGERGIDTQTACAFCGAKRISINGLRGEHTTLLVDGLPLHSTVSSFYGVEAVPTVGIDSIDIYRGSGAALTVPEAIGGAINIVTKDPVLDSAETIISAANDGQQNYSVLGTKKLGERSGVLLGLNWGATVPIDVDRNGVSELPRQNVSSVLGKFTTRLRESDELSLRVSYADLDTIGGSMRRTRVKQAVPEVSTSDDFIDRDVRRRFIGDERRITDNVEVSRFETAAIYRRQLDADSSLKLSLGGAWQNQDSVYSHGYDYASRDQLLVGIAEYQRAAGDSHLLTFGVDTKNQRMDSSSQSLYVLRSPPLQQDDLAYRSIGAYVQDTWIVDEANELALVLRLDDIETRWTDMKRELHRTVVAPRFFYKHTHNEWLTSRASAGLGYRSPLTLFESQHGTDHNGFVIDIRDLETAQSLTYSLAGQRLDDFFELSTHITRIENMAYGVDRVGLDSPTLFRSSEDPYTVSVIDASYGRRITHSWTLEGLYEHFFYERGYKAKLPVAAIEQRLSLLSNVSWGKWTASQRVSMIGSRDLSAYGYDRHYNVAFTDPDIYSPTVGETFVSERKKQKAPAFFTLDLTFERSLGANLSLGFSVLNVFDYTQTRAGDSPLTWELHGDHYHLDNFHIWGPLRGRQVFLTLKGTI